MSDPINERPLPPWAEEDIKELQQMVKDRRCEACGYHTTYGKFTICPVCGTKK